MMSLPHPKIPAGIPHGSPPEKPRQRIPGASSTALRNQWISEGCSYVIAAPGRVQPPMRPLLKLPPIPNIMGGRRDCSGMEQHQSPIRRDPPQTAGGQAYDPGGICRLMRDQPGILWTHRARGTQRHLRAVPANLRGNRALFFRIICRYRLKTSYMALSKRPRGCTIRPQRRHTGRPQAICRRKGALL